MTGNVVRYWILVALAFGIALASGRAGAEATRPGGWSVESLHGPAFDFSVDLDEATWMSVDVAPNGRTLVFDILGDLYTMPIAGGTATRITSGPAFDGQPRFSPDGRTLVFVSDRSGGNALWLVGIDGQGARQLTHERDASVASPVWSPDGGSIIALRHDDLKGDDGYDLCAFALSDGAATRLVDRKRVPLGPAVSADGHWIYFSVAGAAGAGIDRLDRRSGETFPFVRTYGGAVRPAASPDGRWLAYGRRVGAEERMVLRNLPDGTEQMLPGPLNWDQQDNPESDADLLPGFVFTPDSKAIVFTALGKIWRHDIAAGRHANIPFKARFEQKIHQRLAEPARVDRGAVRLKLLRWTHESPDGRTLFFGAAGKIFSHDRKSGRTRQIAEGEGLRYSPAISPDGRWLAYVTWSDREAGRIYKTPVDHFAPVRLTGQAGHYEHLAWSPDGTRLVFLKSSGGELRGEPNLTEATVKSVMWIDARGPDNNPHEVATVSSRGDRRQEMRPSFNGRGDRIYFTETPVRRQPTLLYSVALDGTGRKPHLRFHFADDVMPSPDGKWVAFTEQFEVYLAPFSPDAARLVDLDPRAPAGPVTRLSTQGGYFVNWADRGRAVTWSWGNDYFKHEIGDSVTQRTSIDARLPRAGARGRILLRGARIVTMGPAGIIEAGDLLVENDRIAAIGPPRSISPAGARIVDVTGKTIIPGIIDTHNHYRQGRNPELFPENDWGYVVQLAYGVTTIRDPSARSQSIFTQGEMIETGASIGPRLYSTGEPIYFDDTAFSRPPVSLDDARLQVRRLKALGAQAIKSYTLPRREQRQWVVQAAREEGLLAIPEGAQKIAFDVTLLMDGYSTLEHAIKTVPLYKDVTALFAATGTYLVPTLIVGPGGDAEQYYFAKGGVTQDRKLARFTPEAELDPTDRVRPARSQDNYFFKGLARTSAEIVRQGGRLALGAHGNLEGLGVHWEMWEMTEGGLSPIQTLRAATIDAAGALGLEADIGSLEPGKLADLVILDADPVADIHNTGTIAQVMKSGVLWDAATMDQIWPLKVSFPGFYWRKAR